jgi:hypothetical protein
MSLQTQIFTGIVQPDELHIFWVLCLQGFNENQHHFDQLTLSPHEVGPLHACSSSMFTAQTLLFDV